MGLFFKKNLQAGSACRGAPCALSPWQAVEKILDKTRRACRPTWRHAFVRFTENRAVRNSFLSDILRGFGTETRERLAGFQRSVLSETAGARFPKYWAPGLIA